MNVQFRLLECNAIIHVLRCFDNDNIIHVDGNVNPIRDKETIDIELQLKDLETVEKRLEKIREELSEDNWTWMNGANQQDLELYDFCNQLLE